MTRLQLTLLLLLMPLSQGLSAGAFVFSGESNGIEMVAHPEGYTGTGGTVSVDVCIETTTNNQAEMVVPLQNAIAHWNQMQQSLGNLRSGSDNQLAAGQIDWESTMMHELGHCIGLAHPNLASESGLSGSDPEYTKTTDGDNNTFNLTIGADNVRGSSDDTRGDDVNLHWYRRNSNNPFAIQDAPFDFSTYARDLVALPAGHTFAVNGDRTVAGLLGASGTEAIMQQGQFSDEDQRTLTPDDVATLRLARAGNDRTAGNADDYNVQLTYGGVGNGCKITAIIDPAFAGLAVCELGGSFMAGNNIQITSARMRFSSTTNWHFATVRVPDPVADTITVSTGGTATTTSTGGSSLIANDTHPNGTALVLSTSAFPGPVNGSVTLNANGTFSYTHNGNGATSDRFVYRVCANGNNNACSMQRVDVSIGSNSLIFANSFE